MHTYIQGTGEWYGPDRVCWGTGYSGYDDGDRIPEPGEGRNDPAAQTERNIGPTPAGYWTIVGPPHETATHGPVVMALHPDASTETFGRDEFLIHGDSVKTPGTASHGCIILPRAVRERIWASGDRRLRVVATADWRANPAQPLHT